MDNPIVANVRTETMHLRLTLDRDYLERSVYKVALEKIMERAATEPWSFTGEDAAEMARRALDAFHG